jgi:VanZ family protein
MGEPVAIEVPTTLRPRLLVSKLRALATGLACISVCAILALSMVPGAERPYTGMPDSWENFIAYFGTAFLCACSRRTWKGRLLTVLGLIACSISMELLQHFIPGRVPSVEDVIANGIGAFVGTACAVGGVHLINDR